MCYTNALTLCQTQERAQAPSYEVGRPGPPGMCRCPDCGSPEWKTGVLYTIMDRDCGAVSVTLNLQLNFSCFDSTALNC
jgi:hypothetical protein